MNRIIKFRAWDKEKKKFVPQSVTQDFEITLRFDGVFVSDDGAIDGTESGGRLILSQFTGLLDKNGVEIYEGDIIRILYTNWPSMSLDDVRTLDQYKKDISQIGEVIFEKDRFQILFHKKYTGSIFQGAHGEKEVIGNIYSNPELLKD